MACNYEPETSKGRPLLQQMELLGMLIGTSLFQGLSQTKDTFYMATFNKTMGNSLVTANQYRFDTSVLHQQEILGWSGLCRYLWCSFAYLLQPEDAVSLLHVHKLMVHICPCSLCIVHSCTFSSTQWDDEVQLIIRQLM